MLLVAFGLLAGLAASVPPQAPPAHPEKPTVAWTFIHVPAAVSAAKGGFSVTVHGAIDRGWHVYALEEPAGGPLETTVALADADTVDLLHVSQNQPSSVMDASFGQRTMFFRSGVDFTLQLKLKQPAVPGTTTTLHVTIRYQSCNDRVCLPLHTDVLALPLSIGP